MVNSQIIKFVLSIIVAVILGGCKPAQGGGGLVVTQIPIEIKPDFSAKDLLDLKYPPGSRVVVISDLNKTGNVSVLSKGFWSAGNPIVSYDGKRILFVGKRNKDARWQVYEAKLNGFAINQLTFVDGGAMSPCLLPNGTLVFCSPVPQITTNSKIISALYVQSVDKKPARITYSPKPIFDPFVLRDGRILFVSEASLPESGKSAYALFTVNNDGTEITKFAIENDGVPYVYRPRELDGGLVAFLASQFPGVSQYSWAECVSMARPFKSRGKLFGFSNLKCTSIEPETNGYVIACFENKGMNGRSMKGTIGVYRLKPFSAEAGTPIFDDPLWNEVEAVPIMPRRKPLGHMSTIKPEENVGTLLCIDANYNRDTKPGKTNRAAHIKVTTLNSNSVIEVLGYIEPEIDGSFLVEVPANTPFGLETYDAEGKLIHKLPPVIWLRPGENRSCIGCHEPYNRSPHNYRPLAANHNPVELKKILPNSVQKNSSDSNAPKITSQNRYETSKQ